MDLLKDFGIDGSKTLESLEGPMMHYDIPTSLMARVANVAKTPLSDVDAEGLRLLVVQKMFTASIVPAAIVFLAREPFAGGNLEEGSLIRSLFQFTPKEFWDQNNLCLGKARSVLESAKTEMASKLSSEGDPEVRSLLLEAKNNLDEADKYSSGVGRSTIVKTKG